MTKFVRWSGIAHSILAKSHHNIKLGQAREILSAYLGHRTYASLRSHDLAVLQNQAKYVLVDPQMALDRAASLGFPLSIDDWHTVQMALKPSGVSGGSWLIEEPGMKLAATLTVEDSSDPRLRAIGSHIGMVDYNRQISASCTSLPGELPLELQFSVTGEIGVQGEDACWAFPIVSTVIFPRLGNRIYGVGKVQSVENVGQPKEYEPEEPLWDFSYISGFDD
jgi:hypothetical protein